MDPKDLKPGEMLLQPCKASSPTHPVAKGWLREEKGLVGLVVWPRGDGYYVKKQGWSAL